MGAKCEQNTRHEKVDSWIETTIKVDQVFLLHNILSPPPAVAVASIKE